MNNFYITTPIYYVNDVPHIGHAYTSVVADVLARYKRMAGFDVMFLTGTDEHGQKVEKSAAKNNLSPQEFVDNVSENFRSLSAILNLTNDDFIRTTEERHKIAAREIWKRLMDNGHIYLDKYAGWYAVRDEAFYAESELIDGKAPTGAEVEWVEEPSYFFNLSKWQDKLLELYEKNPDFIKPASRRNEVISFVKGGLLDLSVSRTSFKWGVPIPGDEAHIMYVWLDALTNYISATGFPDMNTEKYKKFWPADVHLVGKDILRFHAVYWPAFLMAADLPVPEQVVAHGWWTINGEKMSKSLGNVVSPTDLVNKYGKDASRYFLMRGVHFGNDGNYSEELLISRVNSELVNKVGNLAQRTLSMVYKNCDKMIPATNRDIKIDDLYKLSSKTLSSYKQAMDDFDFSEALQYVITLAEEANSYIDQKAPWTLAKTDKAEMGNVLYLLVEIIRYMAIMLHPFVPESADKILDQLRIESSKRLFSYLEEKYMIKSGMVIDEPKGVFPRLEMVKA